MQISKNLKSAVVSLSKMCRSKRRSGTSYSLREKCPNTEFFLVPIFPKWEILRISPYSVRIWENTDQKKLRIRAFFTQWLTLGIYYKKRWFFFKIFHNSHLKFGKMKKVKIIKEHFQWPVNRQPNFFTNWI